VPEERVTVEVGGRELSLSNLAKVLYPEAGFTKGEVIDYYVRIAPVLLPHLAGRQLTLKRYPNGVDQPFFFEKRCPPHAPDWIQRAEGDIPYCVIDGLASLIWVANLASLELHPSLAPAASIMHPGQVMFDLDPGAPANVVDCARLALVLRELFRGVGLEAFPKTSGSKGLQLSIPLNDPDITYEDTRRFSRAVAQAMERQYPDQVISTMTKRDRVGKVFVDWAQNHPAKTTICVYSLRAMPRPTVSTPVSWEELEAAVESGDAAALVFDAPAVLERVDRLGDLHAPVATLRQTLPDAP
jgi:bifunctional non-homologous end joining protein LigD